MPASSAACTTRAVPPVSSFLPKLLQPRPTTETLSEPMERVCTLPPRCAGGLPVLHLDVRQHAIEIVEFNRQRLGRQHEGHGDFRCGSSHLHPGPRELVVRCLDGHWHVHQEIGRHPLLAYAQLHPVLAALGG